MKIRIYTPSIGAVLAALIVLWLNSGCYTYISRYLPTIVMYGVFAIWFLFSINRKRGIWDRIRNCIPMFPSLLLFGVGAIVFKNKLANSYLMFCVYTVIILLICDYYRDKESDFKFIFYIWIFDTIVVGIKTLIALRSNPLIIRIMSTGSLAVTMYGVETNGIAGYGGIISYIFLSLFLFSKMLDREENKKWILITFFVFLEIIIFMSQIGILILTNILGIFIVWTITKLNNKKYRMIAIIFFIIIGFAIWYLLPSVLNYISNSSTMPELIRDKAKDLNILLYTDSALTENTLNRLDRYNISVNSFLSFPIFGGIVYNAPVGGHSTWLDLLGLFGLFSFFFFIALLKTFELSIRNVNYQADKTIVKTVLFIYMGVGLIDPIHFQTVSIIFTFCVTYLFDYFPNNSFNIQDDANKNSV